MLILKKTEKELLHLKEKPFKLEKDIQKLFEEHLSLLTPYQLIKSEFTIKNHRIDTLAFDPENKTFVIIEYKRSQNLSVVDQGMAYLSLMLEYKADFIVEYNETQKMTLKREDVDWSQSKVIFVSPAFTDFQIEASNFKDLPIELWQVNQFDHGVLIVNPLKKSKAAPSIKQIKTVPSSALEQLKIEIKVYSEEDHLADKSEEVKELYEDFKQAILRLDSDIEVTAKKVYIAFKKNKNIVDFAIQQRSIKIWINMSKGQLDDPKGLAKDVSQIGHHGNGDYQLIVKDTHYLEYIMSLIKQAL
ncbi:endonuclease NucS domain-containing protein [Pelistega ratti]|uniref:endonuclease NucS domain-containing protein n=1 Tax=Pelistega ratti TaxID=2652177 RepID=UPI001358435E|nr:endonuclease NucS domain-containing protein [Pelistega ratti]